MIQENYSFKYDLFQGFIGNINVRPCVSEPWDMPKKDTITPQASSLIPESRIFAITIRSGRFQIERN